MFRHDTEILKPGEYKAPVRFAGPNCFLDVAWRPFDTARDSFSVHLKLTHSMRPCLSFLSTENLGRVVSMLSTAVPSLLREPLRRQVGARLLSAG